MIDKFLNFDSFVSLNESLKNLSKKELGVWGPSSEGSFEILIKEGGLFSLDDSGKEIILSSGDVKLNIPKNSCKVLRTGNSLILKTLPYTNWFIEDKNLETFENFVFDSVENSYLKENKEDSILDNLEIILEEMGIDIFVNSIEKKREDFYEIYFSNGMEGECVTDREIQFIKTLKIYKGDGAESPIIKLKILGPEVSSTFSTHIGKFQEKTNCFSDMIKNPIFRYLVSNLTNKKDSEIEDYMVDYYKRLMKYHDWKESSNEISKQNSHNAERTEINRIKEILKHTHEEKDLDVLFIEARDSFLSSNQNP
jgi:hypothetical protein